MAYIGCNLLVSQLRPEKPPIATGGFLLRKTGTKGRRKPEGRRRQYYENDLMNHPANREGFGEVKFYKGSGWSKFESTTQSAPEQLKLLPAVKPVMEKRNAGI
jgi:hypothetical protein